MILDGHNYCVPQLDSPQGYDSLAQKMRTVQSELGGHHQPVWRVRDRAPADNGTLVDPETSALREVEWTRHLGRLAWKFDGETYTKQYLPPMLHNLECPPEVLIAEMDYAGVDLGILHTFPTLARPDFLNGYLREAVRRFPDRLVRLIAVSEAAIPRDPDGAIRQIEDEVAAGGQVGIQFIPGFYYNPTDGVETGNEAPWDDGAMRPFWEAVASTGLPVFFTLIGGRGGPAAIRARPDAYLSEQRVLIRWMERYPDTTVVVTHGLPWSAFLEGDRITFPEEIWEPFANPRCHLQLLFPIGLGAKWEYPWKEAEPTVQECVERIGADRLMWGTDMPMVGRYCTYRQALDQYRVHCEFLTADQRADIIGGTAARVLNLVGP